MRTSGYAKNLRKKICNDHTQKVFDRSANVVPASDTFKHGAPPPHRHRPRRRLDRSLLTLARTMTSRQRPRIDCVAVAILARIRFHVGRLAFGTGRVDTRDETREGGHLDAFARVQVVRVLFADARGFGAVGEGEGVDVALGSSGRGCAGEGGG